MKHAVAVGAATLVFAFGVLGLGSGADAGQLPPGPVDFRIDASGGGTELHLTPTVDDTLSVIGEGSTAIFSLLFDITVNPDPAISGSFTLKNLSGVTQTFSVSATLGGLSMPSPTTVSGFYGEVTFTDTAPTDAEVTLASGLFYRALLDSNSVIEGGSFDIPVFGGNGIFGTVSKESFPPTDAPFGVLSTISVSFPGFSLTPGDTVQVPFEFVVVPEPSFASLFALSCAVFFVLSRRKFFLLNRGHW